MSVTFMRNEINNLLIVYYMIRDCIDGEPAIKGFVSSTTGQIVTAVGGSAVTTQDLVTAEIFNSFVLARARRYLPMPNAEDQSPANRERYRQYVARAIFYNVGARTLEGMVGQIFMLDPVVKVPDKMKDFLKNVDGQGLSAIQVSDRAVRYALSYGRAGLFVDYPTTDAPAKQADVDAGYIQPIVRVIPPWNVINWATIKRGARTVLSLVVIRETLNDIGDDGFTFAPFEQYRVLRLDDVTGNYTQEIWTQGDAKGEFSGEEEFTPLDANGQPFDEIPFMFIGAENNDDAVDKPPLYDLCALNLGHYRNSADYEESCHITGQPTPWVSGLTAEWFTNQMKETIVLGARSGIPLPPGAQCGLLEARPNSMPKEAMEHKETQMIALGAKLVQQARGVSQRTATQVVMETASETSTLAKVAQNVSDAFATGLKWAARFMGVAADSISYQLNKSFELNRMTFDDQAKLVATWQRGGICWEEMREGLRKAGTATLPDDEAKAKVQEEMALMLATGPVADPFNKASTPPANPNPNTDPNRHATKPATRGQGKGA